MADWLSTAKKTGFNPAGKSIQELLCAAGSVRLSGSIRTQNIRFKPVMPTIRLKDGAELSVQASRNHYCHPREDAGPYSHVEVMLYAPSAPDNWRDYQNGPDSSVFSYLPIEYVQMYIAAHGGINYEETFF